MTTSSNQTSFFDAIPMAPRDPILGITEAFRADTNPKKVNLGVGVYYDDDGHVPLLKCVLEAEKRMDTASTPHTYLPIDGIALYDEAVQKLIFGENNKLLSDKRVATVQSLGGTGGLKIGADFLKRFAPNATVWISDPTWANHRGIFESAGFNVKTYPYYDNKSRGVNFESLLHTFSLMNKGDIVVLHACCHNPTGVDLNDNEWDKVIDCVKEKQLIPFLDMAYQGFSKGINEDGKVVKRFAQSVPHLLISNSFSKSFSLYGERVGAFSIVCCSEDETARTLSQLKRVVRTNYSNPPIYGAKIVSIALSDPALRKMWEDELALMRDRIHDMREQLAKKLAQKKPDMDFSYITNQNGMFSYTGLTPEQVDILREKYSIYMVRSGRICVAALNSHNLDYVVDAIANVL